MRENQTKFKNRIPLFPREIHGNVKSRGAGEKDLGLSAPLESILSSWNWRGFLKTLNAHSLALHIGVDF